METSPQSLPPMKPPEEWAFSIKVRLELSRSILPIPHELDGLSLVLRNRSDTRPMDPLMRPIVLGQSSYISYPWIHLLRLGD